MARNTYEFTTELRHHPRTFHSAGGLFSKDKVAKSTRLLVEQISPKPGDRILDYGCGYGAVGIGLSDSAHGIDIQMVDSDIRAVRLAQRNVHANGTQNVHVVLDHTLNRFRNGDCLSREEHMSTV